MTWMGTILVAANVSQQFLVIHRSAVLFLPRRRRGISLVEVFLANLDWTCISLSDFGWKRRHVPVEIHLGQMSANAVEIPDVNRLTIAAGDNQSRPIGNETKPGRPIVVGILQFSQDLTRLGFEKGD